MASETVAVINSDAETIAMLSVALELEGLSVTAAFTHDLRDGSIDIGSFMRAHDPSVVLYDVAAPYDMNWALFERLRAHPDMGNRPVVLTSTDAAGVEQLAARDPGVIGIASKPFDLDVVMTAMKGALRTPFRDLPPLGHRPAWRPA